MRLGPTTFDKLFDAPRRNLSDCNHHADTQTMLKDIHDWALDFWICTIESTALTHAESVGGLAQRHCRNLYIDIYIYIHRSPLGVI